METNLLSICFVCPARAEVMLRMEDGFGNWKDFMFRLNSLSKYFGHRGRLDRFRDLFIDRSENDAFAQDRVVFFKSSSMRLAFLVWS